MRWRLSHRADPRAAAMADRHYSRQKPGTAQFVPPGRCLVLVAGVNPIRGLWVTSWPFAEYTKHEWAGAWVCSLFRNEGAGLSSELIAEAVAVTRWYHRSEPSWRADPEPPQGIVTFVKPAEIKSRNPGYCYKRAGWSLCGETKAGLPALQQLPSEMPPPRKPVGVGAQAVLF